MILTGDYPGAQIHGALQGNIDDPERRGRRAAGDTDGDRSQIQRMVERRLADIDRLDLATQHLPEQEDGQLAAPPAGPDI